MARIYSLLVLYFFCAHLELSRAELRIQEQEEDEKIEWEKDVATSTTNAGAGIFIQSLQVTRHFMGGKTPIPLAWATEFAYSRFSFQSSNDHPSSFSEDAFGANLGLLWEAPRKWEASFKVGANTIPQEKYSNIGLLVRVEKAIPVHRKTSRSHFEKGSFLSELLDSSQSDEQEVIFSMDFGDNQHLIQVPHQNSVLLGQYFVGPEISWMIHPDMGFTLKTSFFYYTQNVDYFISLLGSEDDELRQVTGASAVNSGGAVVNQLLTFPQFSIDIGFSFPVSDHESCELNFNRMSYSSQSQAPTYTLSPMYHYTFKETLRVGLGINTTVGSGNQPYWSGSLEINCKI